MVLRTPSEDDPLLPTDVDLSQIFIGREQQLDFFRVYLERWQRQMSAISLPLNTPPSPNNKLQGLVILLHGRGGFGKTVLLKHLHEIALAYEQELYTSVIVDWEFAVAGNRPLFNPAPGEHMDASRYFALLRDQLALALAKRPDEFKEYQSAVKNVDEAKRRARSVLESLQGESHYTWLRELAGEGVLALVRLIPKSEVLLSQGIAEKIKEIAGDGAQIGVEQIKQVWERLHDHLGTKLNDYLDQTTRLGQGLGSDLAHFTKRDPILLFFDTYEEIDEADDLLRIVMGAAGGRVGWIIAGRDNLWAGLSQRLRSEDTVYGYKDIVPYHLGWSVDFSADGVGDFILSDIQHYFAQLSELAHPMLLPTPSEKDAEYLLHVTKGVPLAIRIAASLYLEKPDLRLLLEGTESKREIVDQMVRRYLLHTRTSEADKARLYGLALLRRTEEPNAVCAALDLPPAISYRSELTRLQRRYGFVFTKQEVPSLHQEVRHFLRLWLLEHHSEPGIAAVIQKLKQVHEEVLQELETTRSYASIRARLEDDQWVECYIDLTEQYFWQDAAQGVTFALPFMCAASIYRREANREVFAIGTFFESVMRRPYRNHWQWAAHSLRYTTSHQPLPDEIAGLQDLVKLAGQSTLAFSPPLPDVQKELEAALWCRLGEAYQGMQDEEAIYWYKRGLSQLVEETEQSEEAIKALLEVDIEEKKQEPSSTLEEGYKPDAKSQKQSQTTASADSYLEQSSGPAKTQLNQLQVNKGIPRKQPRRQRHSLRSTLVEGLSRRSVIAGAVLGLVTLGGGLVWWRFSRSSRNTPHLPSNLLYVYHGHSDIVTGVTWSPDGIHLASGSYDHTVQVWNASNGEHIYTYSGHSSAVTCVAWSPDGSYVASGGETVQIWDAANGDHVYTYHGHTDRDVHSVAWSPNGTRVASGGKDHTIQVFNVQDGSHVLIHSEPTQVWGVAWSPDGTRIASGCSDSTVQVWNAQDGNLLLTYKLHPTRVVSIAWSPDGARVVSGGDDGIVRVWDAQDGNTLLTYYAPGEIRGVAWSSDGTRIVSGTTDSAQVWNVQNRNPPLIYRGNSGTVYTVAWSPDGTRIASGGSDRAVQVWRPA